MELMDETTIKYTETGALTAIQTGCLCALHGSQKPNSTQQLRYVGNQ